MCEYKLEYDEEGNPEPCDCCEYENVKVHFFDSYDGFLCELCSKTHITRLKGDEGAVGRAVAWIGNHILNKIEETNAKSSS